MPSGYVCIAVDDGSERRVRDLLVGVPGVREVAPRFGDVDFYVGMDAATHPELAAAVARIRRLPGVRALLDGGLRLVTPHAHALASSPPVPESFERPTTAPP